jgi:hypothetical protein
MKRLTARLLTTLLAVFVGSVFGISAEDPPTQATSPTKTSKGIQSDGLPIVDPPPGRTASPSDLELGRRRIAAVVNATGGNDLIDGIRTLIISSTVQQHPAPDRELRLEVMTWIEFPNRLRRTATSNAGSLTTVVTPDDSFAVVGSVVLPLSEFDRFRFEESILRHPIALLKTRRDSTFAAFVHEPDDDGEPANDILDVSVMGKRTLCVIDPATQYIIETRFEMTSEDGGARQPAVIRFSDYQRAAGLMLPHHAEMWVGDQRVSTSTVKRWGVNESIPRGTFQRPMAKIVTEE